MFFNLLYRAMKYDHDDRRVNVFAKRLMSTALHTNSATVAGGIFLLNEVARSKPSLRVCMENIPVGRSSRLLLDDSKREPSAALITSGFGNVEASWDSETVSPPTWELSLLSQHYHPSVSTFASTIGDICYAGDPLRDFALAPFLDKFSYRNPKSNKKVSERFGRRKSIAERRSGMELQIQSRRDLPVNDPKFLEQDHVSEQDDFFLKFFSERARRDQMKGMKTHGESSGTDDDEIELTDDEEESAEEIGGVDFATKSFAELEQAWETDSEEEAFADSLAEELLESAADGKVNFDDEDPNLSDWSDYDGKEGELTSRKDDHLFLDDDDEFLDTAYDSETDASMENLRSGTSVFANVEEYEKSFSHDSKHSPRKKRRKTLEN